MFQMGEILGEGSFGRFYRGRRHGQAVAVKRTMLTHHAIHEVDMLRLLEHPNILSLHEAIVETDYLFMVMPLCDEDLNAFLRREGPRSQPSRLFRVMRQLAAALTECHRQRIVHRDIKPANILRRRCRFLLADFGLAAQPLLTEPAGAIVYWAPEQRRLEPYDTSVDLWALGLVAVEVASRAHCTGTPIFFCSSCGLLGILTRNCPCHSHHRQREAAVQCDIPSASTQSEPPRKFRMPTSRELALRACPRCRELRVAKANSRGKSRESEARY
ncbi:cell division control protein 2 homolog 3-like [Coccinella septempunctata]|uniref:cell division control protein 2 homolog 3-like n=1 Tax=Coccinella septempunctata TaxID=41139 RepID=UPI001D064198|nr:cell division control protein 2 homolog 3-like [Coccinella septempunctata]